MAVSKIVTIGGTRYRHMPDGYKEPVSEFYGKSTDEKPNVGVSNADIFYEMDTQKVFLYDEADHQWVEQ